MNVEVLEERRAPAVFVVTTNLDGTVAGHLTLRQAITMSNATPGPNTITFDIGSGGVQTIALSSPLPALTQPVSIFGGSQTGTTYSSPGIILSGAGSGDGFDVYGGNSTIEGFVIHGFTGYGIVLKTNGGDEIINDSIGTNAAGTGASANTQDGVLINNVANNAIQGSVISGNSGNGIEITGAAAANNLIGSGSTANANVGTASGGGDFIGVNLAGTVAIGNGLDGILIHNSANNTMVVDNVISGNSGNGVHITGTGAVMPGLGTTGNALTGNFIGTDITGTKALGNGHDGILIDGGANTNSIGDGSTADANVISANGGNGIHMTGVSGAAGTGTAANAVEGDFIGTDITGTIALGNKGDGVLLDSAANNNMIGASGSVTVISANLNGVHLTGAGTTANSVISCYIGTDITGTVALGNTGEGVLIDHTASTNTIGDGTTGDVNVISGNAGDGLHITGAGTKSNIVLGNYIGTDLTGTVALGNGAAGVLIDAGASANTIGADGGFNVISGNVTGIHISGASGNSLLGNFIGTDSSGSLALGNTGSGILLDSGASSNMIGDDSGGGNTISANGANGIYLNGTGVTANAVAGNFIGTDSTGSDALGNSGEGILIANGASSNDIGDSSGSINVISANTGDGIHITGTGSKANSILADYIGTDISGSFALGNGGDGILIDAGANSNTVGSVSTINVISGNLNGIRISGSSGNSLLGNYIGTDVSGSTALGNTANGILLDSGASGNTIGSDTTGGGNIISANGANGVYLHGTGVVAAGSGTFGNTLLGNYIGTDVSGGSALGNSGAGVLMDNGANANRIGDGTAAGANVISANTGAGIHLEGSNLAVTSGHVGTANNVVAGNFIGTDISGSVALGNGGDGVLIDTGASGNTIGSLSSINVISANLNGIHITGTGAGAAGTGTTGNVIVGDYIGTDVSGTVPLGNTNDGILLDNGANGNKIGNGATSGANVISGNTGNGVEINGSNLTVGAGQVGTAGNPILGNLIGTDLTGSVAVGNGVDGILIDGGATGVVIGATGSHDVISGNTNGIEISGAGTTGNSVVNDYIGTDITGTAAVGNTGDGVLIDGGASGNTIGALGSHNIISANNNGVHLSGTGAGAAGAGTTGNIVLNNYIGTDVTGAVALGNTAEGILIDNGANANQVGNGATTGLNVISGNGGDGIHIDGSSLSVGQGKVGTANNTVLLNYIGTDLTGVAALGNTGDGVLIDGGATGNTIGSTTSHNVISGNSNNGVEISGAGTTGNFVIGNDIGPDKTGLAAPGNGNDGVLIGAGASGNTIGGSLAADRNIISGNNANGVQMDGAGTTLNNVLGNYIGTDATGNVAMANSNNGVLISNGAGANNIGNGTAAGANVISGNSGDGIEISGGSTGNLIEGNKIGAAANGSALGNADSGVFITGSNGNMIGGETAGDGNVIEFNAGSGVVVASGTGNAIRQNSIYANGEIGIDLNNDGVTQNTPGGSSSGANNDENYPVITSADFAGSGAGTDVTFTFSGAANTTYQIELFDSPTADSSGYGEGETALTPTPISVTTNSAGVAINPANSTDVFSVNGLAGALTGTVISATATDAAGNTSEFSQAVNVISKPPTVENVTLATNVHGGVTGIVFTFSAPLNPATVNASTFELFNPGPKNLYTSLIKLAKKNGIVYNPETFQVTLTPATALAGNHLIKVYVNGTTDPVEDPNGNAIDGEYSSTLPSGDSVPGGDFAAYVSFGGSISYKDGSKNTVSLSLSKGRIELVEPLDGLAGYIELTNIVAGHSTLTGKVKTAAGKVGVTSLEGITGLTGVVDKLPSSEFTVGSSTLV